MEIELHTFRQVRVKGTASEDDIDTQFYRFVVAFAIVNGIPPTLDEVRAGIGLTSHATSLQVRDRLCAAGKLAPHVKGLNRDLVPTSLMERWA